MAGYMSLPWVTWVSPRRTMTWGLRFWISSPSNSIVPSHTGSSPETALSRVDLPVPLPPSSATMRPSGTVMSIPRRICTLPYPVWRLRMVSTEAPSPVVRASLANLRRHCGVAVTREDRCRERRGRRILSSKAAVGTGGDVVFADHARRNEMRAYGGTARRSGEYRPGAGVTAEFLPPGTLRSARAAAARCPPSHESRTCAPWWC